MTPSTAARRRTLWALLSGGHSGNRRDLARQVGVHVETVIRDLAWLEGAGYIERVPNAQQAVRVVIPLATVSHAANVAPHVKC